MFIGSAVVLYRSSAVSINDVAIDIDLINDHDLNQFKKLYLMVLIEKTNIFFQNPCNLIG